MHEINGSEAAPETPPFAEVSCLIFTAFGRAGTIISMADRLHASFRDAGLAAPELRFERVAGGVERQLTSYLRDMLIGLLPLIEREGLTTAGQLDSTRSSRASMPTLSGPAGSSPCGR